MIIGTVALEKGLRVIYNVAMKAMLEDAAFRDAAALYTEVKSDSDQEKYGWLGDIPLVQEWLGDRTAGSIADYDYTIINKNWIVPVEIDKNELDDDKMGIIKPRVDSMPSALYAHRLDMIDDLIVDGTTGLAYDGEAFFANRTAPNDNLLAGTGTSVAQIQTDIAAAYAAMYNFQSDVGRAMRMKMDTIVCPVELLGVMLAAVKAAKAETAFNPAAQWIKRIVPLAGATDVNDWYGFATGVGSLKPFILQVREEPKPTLDDTMLRRNRHYIFQAEGRYNAGYGFFQMALKTVNA